jgi:hypothetical protein
MTKALVPALALIAGCTVSLLDVSPERFACVDDTPIKGSELQCPEQDRCAHDACTPRLGCFEPDAELPGCKEGTRRCDLVTNPELAAVSCLSGIPTTTSAIPADPASCECPDGTYCVAWAAMTATIAKDAYPLFLLPRRSTTSTVGPAIPLPVGQLGIQGQNLSRTVCARVCSSELDCPGAHTCRAAAVVGSALLADPKTTRSTIGVCYPDRLPNTATVAEQPDPLECLSNLDCGEQQNTRPKGRCQTVVVPIPDHPTVPAGSAWTKRRALIPRCTPVFGMGGMDGAGCTSSNSCNSGVCLNEGGMASNKCATLCDPQDASAVCGASPETNGCGVVRFRFDFADGSPALEDLGFACE